MYSVFFHIHMHAHIQCYAFAYASTLTTKQMSVTKTATYGHTCRLYAPEWGPLNFKEPARWVTGNLNVLPDEFPQHSVISRQPWCAISNSNISSKITPYTGFKGHSRGCCFLLSQHKTPAARLLQYSYIYLCVSDPTAESIAHACSQVV